MRGSANPGRSPGIEELYMKSIIIGPANLRIRKGHLIVNAAAYVVNHLPPACGAAAA
jgi:hypothetical protein